MNESIIQIHGLSRRFGQTLALDQIDLEVTRGKVLGLVGENGAGKTTLIKHLLGLYKAQHGSITVFGLDPVKDPVGVLGRIGYLSENREMPEWMTAKQYIIYTRAFYPTWDIKLEQELTIQFELDTRLKIKHLSRGQRAKLGLLVAMAYKPDLLLFDEPSSGLDPVVRRDMLGAIVRAIAEEGRTVVLSSHLLDEVERVADTIVMLHAGGIILSDPLEQIRSCYHRFTLRLENPDTSRPTLPGMVSCTGGPVEWSMVCKEDLDRIKQAVSQYNAQIVDLASPSLDDIFVAHAKADTVNQEVNS